MTTDTQQPAITATEHHITVQRTARYYTLGERTERTKNIWFVLHGYGQLAQYFIRRFDVVQDEETLIVAPEGLSRLYLNGEYSKIGASWITREDRDNEARDYVAYLNQVYDTILQNHDASQLNITLMGFSQGAATACRWLANGHVPASRLLLWAGFFPNGVADVIATEQLAGLQVDYVYGEQDEYIAQMPDPAAYLQRIQTDVPHITIIPFDGGHTVERAVLQVVK
jgi:predicted esterase